MSTRNVITAVLAFALAASIVAQTTASAYAYKTTYDEDGHRYLNGHYLPGTVSVHGHVMTEVYQCSWFVAECDLSWLTDDLIAWLKSTNNYATGNLRALE